MTSCHKGPGLFDMVLFGILRRFLAMQEAFDTTISDRRLNMNFGEISLFCTFGTIFVLRAFHSFADIGYMVNLCNMLNFC